MKRAGTLVPPRLGRSSGDGSRAGGSGAPRPRVIDWGCAERMLPGESAIGDRALVRIAGPRALAAVIDGIGHGVEAARAAELAAEVLVDHAGESPVALLARCDEALRGTRGAVISLALFDAEHDLLHWAGVGNVEGVLLRHHSRARTTSEVLVRRAGVVGTRREQRVHVESVPLQIGDTLVFATDGVKGEFERGVRLDQSPQRIAEQILAESGSAVDDALVLVARYLGVGSPAAAPAARTAGGGGARPRTGDR